MTTPAPNHTEPVLERYRSADRVRALSAALARLRPPPRPLRIMHVCGTHENALCQFGLRALLPPWLRLIAGPGCPVCVCPASEIDLAVRLATDRGATVATFGDVVRVPARTSLLDAKARGADCRVVYGIDDAARIAREEPSRQVVFFAVGFETTACTSAAAALRGLPDNLSLLVSHRTVPRALEALLALEGEPIDGFILPGHVTAVAGLDDYASLGVGRSIPLAVAGFEPVDLLSALFYLAQEASAVKPSRTIYNAYARVVRPEGNPAARAAMAEVFEACDAAWRGIGILAGSGLRLRGRFADHDAVRRFEIAPDPELADVHPGCRCGDVLLGRVEPEDCKLFGKTCTPDRPLGPCMVAFEGTCHARYRSRGQRGRAQDEAELR